MNWKEQFDLKMRGSVLAENPYANELAKFYIQHEIIEKLIEDIYPIIAEEHYSDRKEKMIQLRDKWL